MPRFFLLLFTFTVLCVLPAAGQSVPDPHFYDYDSHAPVQATETPYGKGDGYTITRVTYTSPVQTPYPEDNTVTAYLFLPNELGPHPAVVALHEWLPATTKYISTICRSIARHHVAALAIVQPFSLNRRPDPHVPQAEYVSSDVPQTLRSARQAVLDVRRGLDYLSQRTDIDSNRLGITGISLGGIVAGLAAGVDPRIHVLATFIGGADIADIYWDSYKTRGLHAALLRAGWTYSSLKEAMIPVESSHWIHGFDPKNALLINGRYDIFVEPKQAKHLASALGGAKIVWMNTGHDGPALSNGLAAELGASFLEERFFHPNAPFKAPDTLRTRTIKLGFLAGGQEGFSPVAALQLFDFDRAARYSLDGQATLRGLSLALSARIDLSSSVGLEFPLFRGQIKPRPYFSLNFTL